MWVANQNREAIMVFVDVFLQRWWKKSSTDCFVVIFFSIFIFSIPFKVIWIVIKFMFLDINIFYTLLRTDFSPSRKSGPKHTYVREHKLYCLIIAKYSDNTTCRGLCTRANWNKPKQCSGTYEYFICLKFDSLAICSL